MDNPFAPDMVEERESPDDLDAIREQVVKFCNASAAKVREQEDDWALLDLLHENKMGPNEWALATSLSFPTDNTRKPVGTPDAREDTWLSNTLYSPSHLTDMVVANVYGAIFDGPDYLTIEVQKNRNLSEGVTPFQPVSSPDMNLQGNPFVLPGIEGPLPPEAMGQGAMTPPGMAPPMPPPPPPPPQSNSYPLGNRVQNLLAGYLEEGQVHARIADSLKDWVHLGTLAGKTSWHELTTLGPKDPETGLRERIVIEGYPVIHPIPLNKFLPDPCALSSNVQEWRMVGHRVDRTYDQIISGFDSGQYDLNRDEFEETWSPEGGANGRPDSITGENQGAQEDDELTRLTLWEVHGQFATSEGFIEGSVTLVTDRDAERADTGLMLRYVDHPVMENNKRPIVVAHFSPRKGPFGKGLIHCNTDLIYAISQLICQIQDNARLTAIGMWGVPENSIQWQHIQDHGGRPYPGMVAPFDPLNKDFLVPAEMPQFNAQVLFDLVSFFIQLLERRTVTETYQGQGGKRQTATEASILQQQSQRPVQFRTDLLARQALEPIMNLCLSLVCQNAIGNQTIWFQDTDGTPVPATITQEELRDHKFTVSLTMTRSDHTRIAKAQSLERVIPLLRDTAPALGIEGYKIALAEVVKRYFDLLGIDGVDRILKQLTPQEREFAQVQQAIAMGQVPPGGPGPEQGGPMPPEMGPEGGPMGGGGDEDVNAQALQAMALQATGGGQ